MQGFPNMGNHLIVFISDRLGRVIFKACVT